MTSPPLRAVEEAMGNSISLELECWQWEASRYEESVSSPIREYQ